MIFHSIKDRKNEKGVQDNRIATIADIADIQNAGND